MLEQWANRESVCARTVILISGERITVLPGGVNGWTSAVRLFSNAFIKPAKTTDDVPELT
jgi:hypothetical protein